MATNYYRDTITRIPPSEPVLALRNRKTGRCYAIQDDTQRIVFGCSDGADVLLDDPYASGIHCILERSACNSWVLSDKSKNGTRLNGTRIHRAEVGTGSQIRIGNSEFDVVTKSSDAEKQLVGVSPAFSAAVKKSLRAARAKCSVLILGETGTGKELFARIIHESSVRANGPFVPINCGGIPEQLMNSELFGHVKGAFTGATKNHDGLFKRANGGTLFLDELGELGKSQQPHLLRALESGFIRPVGSALEELVNTRLVAATNRACLDLESSPLRADLFHRLSTIVIELPPLRKRRQDIPVLVRHFLAEMATDYGPSVVDDDTLALLQTHRWPGNIRELRNAVTRAAALRTGNKLLVHDFLPQGILTDSADTASAELHHKLERLSEYDRTQRSLIADAYLRRGSIRRAAQDVGMAKSTFADLCRRYGIETRKTRKKG